jgi:hypothetical protein
MYIHESEHRRGTLCLKSNDIWVHVPKQTGKASEKDSLKKRVIHVKHGK